MMTYSTSNNNAYLRADNTWKPIAYNNISNELIFDGADSSPPTTFLYVSFVINESWKVIRYDKTDVNEEKTATGAGIAAQPTTLSDCEALTFQ